MNRSKTMPRRALLLSSAAIGLLLVAGCGDSVLEERAAATCEALSSERFEDALLASRGPLEGSAASDAARSLTECRCIALLSLGDREACTSELAAVLSREDASDWVPHPVLTRMMVRIWQAAGELESAAALVSRAAPVHRTDVELLQLEIALRSQLESEIALLAELEARLDDEVESIPQRLVLGLAHTRRAAHGDALRVLGEVPPPIDHPLAMPWYESRIAAQAASGDLAAVQATFASWHATGWDRADLEARYALRLSTDQLIDPERDTIELLQAAIASPTPLPDRNVVWGLHRRLVTELLAAGRPEEALVAYDAATQVVEMPGISRDEVERAIRLAQGGAQGGEQIASEARLRFRLAASLVGGTLHVSPGPAAPPDAGYRAHPIEALPNGEAKPIELASALAAHPRRWIVRDGSGAVRGSGAVWPEAGLIRDVEVAAREPGTTNAGQASRPRPVRRPADGRRRVFAILSDCADWRLTEYLRERGQLPFHDHLFDEGYRAVLESRPAFTAAALQSLVWPARAAHPGTLGWIHHLGLELAGLESVGRNPVAWLTPLLPTRPNLFETLGAGSRVTANMLLAHGRIDAGRHAELIGPHGDHRKLPPQSAYRLLRPDELAAHPTLNADPDTKKFSETIAAEMDAANEIAEAGEVDFLFLRLEALDLMTHAHYGALDGRGQDDGRGPLLDAYRYIDVRLAELDARLDEDDWLVFLSDHGIRSSMEHEEDALFFVIGAQVPHGRAPGRPALRGVPRSFAAMLDIETQWPDTGATPWLVSDAPTHDSEEVAALP